MSLAYGQETGQSGITAEMTPQEKSTYRNALVFSIALGFMPLVLLLRLRLSGHRLEAIWSKPSGREILSLLLGMRLTFWTIPAIAFLKMHTRKRRTGRLLPSGDELRARRERKKKGKPLWIRVAVALFYWVSTVFYASAAFGDTHSRILTRMCAIFFCLAAIIFTFEVFQPSDATVARGLLRVFFGKLEYIQISSPELQERIRARYRSEIEQLDLLSFTILFWEGEMFSVFRLLLLYPVLQLVVMKMKGEVLALHNGRSVVLGQAVLASPDRTTYANLNALGLSFRTEFQNKRILKSRNYAFNESDTPLVVARSYVGMSVAQAWASHQESMRSIEAGGNPANRELSFEAYVDMVYRSAGL